MTKLPEKNVLDGSKTPKTTTGEMKDALGKLRDYLNELLGENSTDKTAARLALGIDLAELTGKIEAKADQGTLEAAIETAVQDKADKTGLESLKQTLEKEIAKRGVPIGSIDWFSTATPPAGYLKTDGSAVGRETYPALFAAIGTTFGEGDGETTFNLPNLMGRFAEGNATPGTMKEAGLPNIEGAIKGFYSGTSGGSAATFGTIQTTNGALPEADMVLTGAITDLNGMQGGAYSPPYSRTTAGFAFNASKSNPVYGASDTVQPPALTLLPCIKAFDATVDSGLVDMTTLAQEVAGKVPFADFTGSNQLLAESGYQKLPGGLIIQWGTATETGGNTCTTTPFPLSFPSACLSVTANALSSGAIGAKSVAFGTITKDHFQHITIQANDVGLNATIKWMAMGY